MLDLDILNWRKISHLGGEDEEVGLDKLPHEWGKSVAGNYCPMASWTPTSPCASPTSFGSQPGISFPMTSTQRDRSFLEKIRLFRKFQL